MMLALGIRSAIELTPVPTNMDPAVVASAGAVRFMSSRTVAFHCAAVSGVFAVAVMGVVQANSGSDRESRGGVDDERLVEDVQLSVAVQPESRGGSAQLGRGGVL